MTTKKPVRRTGFTESTPEKYVIDAAVVFREVEYDKVSGNFIGHLIGATNGGVNLSIEPIYRDPEVDGARHVKLKGNQILESAKASVVAKLKEIDVEKLKMALNGSVREASEDEAPAGFHIVESKRYLEAGDYIENIGFVGRLSGTDQPMIAILDNAIVTSGLKIETADNNEAVLEVTFEATASFEQLDSNKLPWRIFYPEVA